MTNQPVKCCSKHYDQTYPGGRARSIVSLDETHSVARGTATPILIIIKKEVPVWFEISGSSPDSSRTLEETLEGILLASVNV